MSKIDQIIRNKTSKPLYIVLEAATSQYRLSPGEEVVLMYEPTAVGYNPGGATVEIDLQDYKDGVGMVVWTAADELLTTDGRPAKMFSG